MKLYFFQKHWPVVYINKKKKYQCLTKKYNENCCFWGGGDMMNSWNNIVHVLKFCCGNVTQIVQMKDVILKF